MMMINPHNHHYHEQGDYLAVIDGQIAGIKENFKFYTKTMAICSTIHLNLICKI